MKKFFIWMAALLLLTSSTIGAAEIAKKLVEEQTGWTEIKDVIKRTSGYRNGYTEPESGIFFCDNGSDPKAQRGVCFSVALNQKTPVPIQTSLWSKAENVSGMEDSEYSLYIDLVYMDGTSLWGQKKSFSTGSHDWEFKKVTIFPAKPIRSISFYGLFRSHSGKAWFKSPRIFRLSLPGQVTCFDNVPVIMNRDLSATQKKRAGKRSLQIRDLGRKTDYLLVGSDPLPSQNELIDLSFQSKTVKTSFGSVLDLKVTSKSEDDRILSLVWSRSDLPDQVNWHSGPRHSEKTNKPNEYREGNTNSIGSSGFLSKYPFGVISYEKEGKKTAAAFGIDPEFPCFYRVAYNASFNEFYIAVDFALTKEMRSIELRLLDFDPRFADLSPDPFRGALDHYYRWFPKSFDQKIKKHGIWMPFHPISKVQGWEDFGFRFKEGDGETGWDDQHDMITFRYTEPGTWWMPLKKGVPRTYEEAFAEVKRLAQKGNRSAQTLLTSGHRDLNGRLSCRLMDTPWCDGAVWSLCDLPGLVPLAQKGKLPYSDQYPVASFEWKWGPDFIEKLYSEKGVQKRGSVLDGEYIDSSETYVTAVLDYCREHFAGVSTSLVYDRETLKPGIYSGLMSYEYIRKIAKDIHARGKLMMANSTPHRFFWLVPLLDILGTETNWNYNNQWRPMSNDDLLYKRAMCGSKPYCFLMNTNFDEFTYEMSEKFMKRSLAYGHFPGYFSANASTGHYFTRPDLYNRDRDLFKKYIPLCRLVSEAGWRPVTEAVSDGEDIFIERFGSEYFTIFNGGQEKRVFSITFDRKFGQALDLVTGRDLKLKEGVLKYELDPEDVLLLKVK